MNILLGVTGSVATIKIQELVKSLMPLGDVRVIATKNSQNFFRTTGTTQKGFDKERRALVDPKTVTADAIVYFDEDEWDKDYKLGDEILHIELRKWANCLVIAPLSANTLAKIANGMCDNLLTCVVRAWDWNKPMFLAPAMNTFMWDNEPTAQQIDIMKDRGAVIIQPVEKKLACGDTGMGGMAPVQHIVAEVNRRMRWLFPLKHCNGIPINHHPGAFGFHRRKNHHTGVDLYTFDGAEVQAVENGIIVHIAQFTGPEVGHDWWERTWGIMIEGDSGVVNYGELAHPAFLLSVGQRVKRGETFGIVKRVLFEDKYRPDIPGHSTSMLHLELYKHGTRDFADWHDPAKNPELLDPTPFLLRAECCNFPTLTWDNPESKPVG